MELPLVPKSEPPVRTRVSHMSAPKLATVAVAVAVTVTVTVTVTATKLTRPHVATPAFISSYSTPKAASKRCMRSPCPALSGCVRLRPAAFGGSPPFLQF